MFIISVSSFLDFFIFQKVLFIAIYIFGANFLRFCLETAIVKVNLYWYLDNMFLNSMYLQKIYVKLVFSESTLSLTNV